MLYVCVEDVMDVSFPFELWNMELRVLMYDNYKSFIMHILYVYISYTLCGSLQCCILYDL